mmetsp:Transcript_114605/g.228079  ORF Transcript_114605/g.228079 Transcript_114605/m.228079 type:complete len:142 (+) Transcript_114605:204-629(+)
MTRMLAHDDHDRCAATLLCALPILLTPNQKPWHHKVCRSTCHRLGPVPPEAVACLRVVTVLPPAITAQPFGSCGTSCVVVGLAWLPLLERSLNQGNTGCDFMPLSFNVRCRTKPAWPLLQVGSGNRRCVLHLLLGSSPPLS